MQNIEQTDCIQRWHDLLAENFVIHNHQVYWQILEANANGATVYNVNWLPKSSFSVFEFDKKKLFILKMAPAVPKEVIAKFAEHGFDEAWVTEEWNLFHEKNPSGKIAKADAMKKLKEAAAARFPNAIPENVAEVLYPAFDPEEKGEVDFVAAARGLAVLFCSRIEIRAQLFFSLVDESGDGKINKAEFTKFLAFVNETQALGLSADELKGMCDEIFTALNKTELTLDDVRDVAAARWGA
ncbi:unnamed protein product [Oikopleura dioica]|uniref:EF-hand domain-containing protein n=1 Tax=Oikopleura dioica TaxID=34765 RepID=E4X2E7_OIKDI|nr:unnamed protein product [Oikopleura dioica]